MRDHHPLVESGMSAMKRIQLENFGPIKTADITFGDLTVLVGPQASGKSLFSQLVKAINDAGAIRTDLKNYGFEWLHGADPVEDYCLIYFGGGLEQITQRATIRRNGATFDFDKIVKPGGRTRQTESTFLIPAQRVLVLQDGWPKPFMAYSAGDPYCMRRFSDTLRLLMEQGMGQTMPFSPVRIGSELRTLVDDAIYIGAKLRLLKGGARKRIVLAPGGGDSTLPYNAWSAGQREFTPLLLGLYWLMPPAKVSRRKGVDTVIIEEPEMGLHPQAILCFGMLVLELLQREYRVIVSTHSPVILDLVWAIGQLRGCSQAKAVSALKDIFGLKRVSGQMKEVFQASLDKRYQTYFFERQGDGVVVRDISSLDPGAEDTAISGWGGLSGFSGRIAEIVGSAVAKGRCLKERDIIADIRFWAKVQDHLPMIPGQEDMSLTRDEIRPIADEVDALEGFFQNL